MGSPTQRDRAKDQKSLAVLNCEKELSPERFMIKRKCEIYIISEKVRNFSLMLTAKNFSYILSHVSQLSGRNRIRSLFRRRLSASTCESHGPTSSHGRRAALPGHARRPGSGANKGIERPHLLRKQMRSLMDQSLMGECDNLALASSKPGAFA